MIGFVKLSKEIGRELFGQKSSLETLFVAFMG
jgi:hypothetical protein